MTPGTLEVAGSRLFGLSGSASSHEWLGLPAGVDNHGAIVDALRRRLAVVNAASEFPTETLDLVRERLHAAADQLLSAAIDQSAAIPPKSPGPLPSTLEPPPATGGDRDGLLRQAARQILAAEGGFSPLAQMKLAQLAKLNDSSVDEVISIARSEAAGSSRSPAAATVTASPQPAQRPSATTIHPIPPRAAPQSPGPAAPEGPNLIQDVDPFARADAEADRWNRKLRMAVVGGGLGLAALAAALIVVGLVLSKPVAPAVVGAGPVNAATPPVQNPAPVAAPVEQSPIASGGATAKRPSPTVGGIADRSPAGETPPGNPLPRAVPSEQAAEPLAWSDLLRGLDAAGRLARTSPDEGVDRFASVFPALASGWTNADRAGLIAATDKIVELVFTLKDRPESIEKLVAILASDGAVWTGVSPPGPTEIPRLAFAAGIFARLARETDFPVSLLARVRTELDRSAGQGLSARELVFESGARRAIARLVPRLTAGADSAAAAPEAARARWRAWVRVVDAVERGPSAERDTVVLRALEGLMVDAAEPSGSRGVYESIGALVGEVSWRQDSKARDALLGWFRAPAVSPSDLHALTAALASGSAAAGVDSSMVLAVNAMESERAQLRERFSTVWGRSALSGRADVFAAWRALAKPQLEAPINGQPAAALGRAVVFTRLNAVASLVWSGQSGAIDPNIVTPDGAAIVPAGVNLPSVGAAPTPGSGGEVWALEYQRAESNIPQREMQLASFSGEPDGLSAAILVREAVRGSPQTIRAVAQRIVRQHGSSVEVLNAFLNIAPLMPATRECSDLVRDVTLSHLPSPRSKAWRVAVRRVLVERLLERIAETGEFAAFDALSASLAGALASDPFAQPLVPARASSSALPATSTNTAPESPPPPARRRDAAIDPDTGTDVTAADEPLIGGGDAQIPGDSESLERLGLRRLAALERHAQAIIPSGKEHATISSITASHAARSSIASGTVQRFVAHQFASAELLAFVTVAEKPARAGAVGPIVVAMHDARAAAGHVFEQVAAAEFAMARLWDLRFSEEAP